MVNAIRNKILNYQDNVNSIYVENEISCTLNTDHFESDHSPFIDHLHHKHITTGDFRIVGNSRPWKLLAKGPNYREPTSANFNEAFAEITTDLDNCIENLANKTKYNANNSDQCKLY